MTVASEVVTRDGDQEESTVQTSAFKADETPECRVGEVDRESA